MPKNLLHTGFASIKAHKFCPKRTFYGGQEHDIFIKDVETCIRLLVSGQN